MPMARTRKAEVIEHLVCYILIEQRRRTADRLDRYLVLRTVPYL